MIRIEVASGSDIEEIIKDDEIYSRIGDDFSPSKEVLELPKIHGCLSGYVDGRLASLYIVDEGKLHFMVKKQYRGNARKLLNKSYKYYNKKVYCVIPLCYNDVIKFAINCKFNLKGFVREYRKINGAFYDGAILERNV